MDATTTKRVTQRTIGQDATRKKVLVAARKEFIEKGYEGTTIRGIAKRIGKSTGAIFANFCSKDDLLGIILEREHMAYGRRFDETRHNGDDFRYRLSELLAFDYQPDRFALLRIEAAISLLDRYTDDTAPVLDRFRTLNRLIEDHIWNGPGPIDSVYLLHHAWDLHLASCFPSASTRFRDSGSPELLRRRLSVGMRSICIEQEPEGAA